MKKRGLIVMTTLMLAGASIAGGCASKETEVSTNAENLTELESKIYEYEQKLAEGTFTAEDYYALADLYEEANLRVAARDLLEQCYRMNFDEESLKRLEGLAINIDEESPEIQEACNALWNQMVSEENYGALLMQLQNSELFATLMPKMTEGVRTYYKSGANQLVIQVGYDNETPFLAVYKIAADGNLVAINCTGSQAQILATGTANGVYNGAYDLWTMCLDNGRVMHEIGCFSAGKLDGDYEANIASLGEEALAGATLESLWNGKDGYSYTRYAGSFQAGQATATQPGEDVIANLVAGSDFASATVYAYTDDGANALWIGTNSAAVAFDATSLMLRGLPTINEYTPGTHFAVAASSDAKSGEDCVRVYDGNIQYFNGSTWETVGSVAEMSKDDPMSNEKVAQRKNTKNIALSEAEAESQAAASKSTNRNVATIAQPEAPAPEAPADTTSKSNTNNGKKKNYNGNGSASNGTPSASNSSGGSSGSSQPSSGGGSSAPSQPSSGGSDAPSQPSQPSSGGSGAPSQPSQPSSGGSGTPSQPSQPSAPAQQDEPEMEWSDDML